MSSWVNKAIVSSLASTFCSNGEPSIIANISVERGIPILRGALVVGYSVRGDVNIRRLV